jgi:diadenosine tetraphosphate (Ap4A) HIT family hydrolase
MTTLIHRRVEAARRGENPTVICRMPSGWAVLSDNQVLRGYALLLPDPVVPGLNELAAGDRAAFLRDMALIGDALLEVTGAWRVNYEILGNTDPVLHAHIIPRYLSEPDERRRMPVWFYDMKSAPAFDRVRDLALMEQIAAAVQKRL